jgi:hypothetical protein
MNNLSKSTNLKPTLVQKNYGKPKPVREHKRFIKDKKADTGFDPKGSFIEFMNHDLIKPLERPKNPIPEIEPTIRWAIHTEKKSPNAEIIPKIQQFKDYNFISRSQDDIDKYKSSFLKTDIVAIRVPKIIKKDEKDSYLNLKSKHGCYTESFGNSWVPQSNLKTMNNRSSVRYNIISHNDNGLSGKIVIGALDTCVSRRKKGVGEFADLTRPFYPNINKQHEVLLDQHPNVFKIHNGIFSHMYDVSHKNGNIIKPFTIEHKIIK